MHAARVPEPRRQQRILWLAVAEARGHLMRATLARELLARAGIAVDILTTSARGAAFAATFGAAAEVLPGGFHVAYDARQNVQRLRTRVAAVRYLAAGCARDLAAIEARADGACAIINDSFHPALLVAALGVGTLGRRVVHVHCEHTRHAVEATGGRGPLGLLVRSSMMRARRIEIVLGDRGPHTLGEPDAGGTVRLPALVAVPRPRASVRAERGWRAAERVAVVYLNPYFHDAALAAAIEVELAHAGYRMHAVGEGFAARPGWIARDGRLADAVAAADVFVSAPGAGAVTMAQTFGVPLVAIATDQPEQRANLGAFGGARVVAVDDNLRDHLRGALATLRDLPRAVPADASLRRTHALWLQTFQALLPRRSC